MGGSSHTESSTKVDPALMALYNQNFAKASDVADNYSYVPYTGQRVAGFNQNQLNSFDFLNNAANDQTSTNAYNSALNTTGGLLNFKPDTVQAGQLSNTDLTPYLNPYTNDVVNTTLGDLQHARDQQQVSDNAAATAANAFGGSRQAVQNANTTNDYLRNVASTTANLRNSAFQNAQQAALADIGTRLQASTTNAANDITGAGLRLGAANSNAALGQAYLNNQIQRGGILSNIGAQQQALQQAQDDAAYEEFMRQVNAPLQAQQIRNQALGMIPQQATTTSSTSQSGGLGGILGGIGSLALGVGSLAMGNPMGIMGILGGGNSLLGQSSGPSMGWT